MKRKKENKKLFRFLIIILIIISVVVVGIKLFEKFYKPENDTGYEIMGSALNEQEEFEEEKELKFKNIDLVSRMEGPLPTTTVLKRINDIFLIQIPEIMKQTKDLEETNLKEYYKQNKSKISSLVRLETEENFLKMIDTMRKISCDLENEFDSCEFIRDEKLGFKFSYTNGESVECIIKGNNSNTFLIEFK